MAVALRLERGGKGRDAYLVVLVALESHTAPQEGRGELQVAQLIHCHLTLHTKSK